MGMEIGNAKPQEKLEALGRLVQAHKPEFIVLQSLNTETIKLLRVQNWATRYKVSTPPVSYDYRKKPACAIMSTYPCTEMKFFNYRDPDTCRYVLWCYFLRTDKQKQSHPFVLATTQLAIGPDKEQSVIREKQLNQALFCLQENEDCFCLGDFSLIDLIDGDVVYDGGHWKDAYLALGSPAEAGDTFVPELNTLIKEKLIPSFRPDRFLYKTRRYSLDGMQLVGTETDPSLKTHISNHFGILATFHILDNANFLPAVPPSDVPCSFVRPDYDEQGNTN